MKTPRVINIKKEGYVPGAVYIGRPSHFGNPFIVGPDGNRDAVLRKYEKWLKSSPIMLADVRKFLSGKDLLCYCHPLKCHGDIILEVANGD